MAFPVAPRKQAIDTHSAPLHSLARLLSSGLRVVPQTRSSVPHALAGHHESIVAAGRRIVHRYASARVAHWKPYGTRAGGASCPPAAAWIGARAARDDGGSPDGEPRGPRRSIHAARQEAAHTREQKLTHHAYARTCQQHGGMRSTCRRPLQEPPPVLIRKLSCAPVSAGGGFARGFCLTRPPTHSILTLLSSYPMSW
jgi:hypothetical protein